MRTIVELPLKRRADVRKQWEHLLNKVNIRSENSIDRTVGIFDDGMLIATASKHRNVLKCFAIDSRYQGEALSNAMASFLMAEIIEEGYESCFIYTKPNAAPSFESLGFNELARVPNLLVLMERPKSRFPSFLANLRSNRVFAPNVAAIVMNANPFTLGHRYLVESASKVNDWVHLFVVSEDVSLFPTAVRKRLVEEGTKDLSNVLVHDTNDYLVSNKTFPSYFLKEEQSVTEVQARLDAILFSESIGPALGITRRYVGNEPFSYATNLYNQALSMELEPTIELIEIDRMSIQNEVVSASRVRSFLKEGNWEEAAKLVPLTTNAFLQSVEGRSIFKKCQSEE